MLAEDEHADEDRPEGAMKSERRLEDVVVHDGPDVSGPVRGEQDGGDRHTPEDRAVASKDLESSPPPVSERNTARSTNELMMRAPMSWNALRPCSAFQ